MSQGRPFMLKLISGMLVQTYLHVIIVYINSCFVCIKSCILIFQSFSFTASTHQRQNAYSLPRKRGQVADFPQWTESPLREHGCPRYCGRQPQTDAWIDMDHHPSLPGESLATILLLPFSWCSALFPPEVLIKFGILDLYTWPRMCFFLI